MDRFRARRAASKSPHSPKRLALLKTLEETARKAGLTVSAGQLRYAGLKLKGGLCLLRGRRWLVIDRAQPFEDLMDIFRQALSAEDMSGLSKESLALLSPYFGEGGRGAGASA